VVWTDDGDPIVLAVLSTMPAQDAVRDDALVADAARAVADTLTRPAGTA
jgi:beta-lactamase class A